jgi:hypothetical protein
MSDAWIGIIGAAIGALAGLGGAWLSAFLTGQATKHKEIQDAVISIISISRRPEFYRKASMKNAIDKEKLFILASEWTEEISRARARVAILAPDKIIGISDYLWQKSADCMMALIDGVGEEDVIQIEVKVNELIFELEAAAGKLLGHRRKYVVRGLD